MTDPEHDRPEAEVPAPAAPPADVRRRGVRPAPESDVKAYIAPIDLPENHDDARRTQELSRIQISPDLDPRRRPTVRRVGVPPGALPGEPRVKLQLDAIPEETAALGTNLHAIADARAAVEAPRTPDFKQATVRMRPGMPVVSPSAPAGSESEAADAPADRHAGPRGTVMMKPRARGGTKMMIAGLAESAALPVRAPFESEDGSKASGANLRVAVLGAVVLLGLATLALFASRGISSGASPTSAPSVNDAPPTSEPQVTAPPAVTASASAASEAVAEPAPTAAADEGPAEPSAEARPSRQARPRPKAKHPAESPSATPTTPPRRAPRPMFDRSEGK